MPFGTCGNVGKRGGKSADAAVQQIKDRDCAQALSGRAGEVLLVGINYDRDDVNKPHSCVIEKMR